ncbi:hypothetical protein [Halorhabdus rudnickae]|uniref:hypothetical protein n=1 Tax=Halorhabdus rudnickae TaxID=1775544 RepID=UPI0014382783|nr:hypothetical protein [Halorhabdus rudnickae]
MDHIEHTPDDHLDGFADTAEIGSPAAQNTLIPWASCACSMRAFVVSKGPPQLQV